MKAWSYRILAAPAVLAASVVLLVMRPVLVHAVETPIELKWAQLIPTVPEARPKSFLSGRPSTPIDPANPRAGAPQAPLQPEGRWMSGPAQG
ncbi:MAG: hypothetical protein J2P50_12770, partial [Hyphomicrobiaceae bacterium]|nr:hypothetical protein [Hyphomicrobiaceae bacterium]